jgi:hypothetical protein
MDEITYLRAQVVNLRNLAAAQSIDDIKRELLALADRCEQLANHLEGNGKETRRGS